MSLFGDLDQEEIEAIPEVTWGLPVGPATLTISSAIAKPSASKGTYGLHVTWTDAESGQSMRPTFVTLPTREMDSDKLAKTQKWLGKFLSDVGVPRSQWGSLEPDPNTGEVEALLGIECTGIIKETPNEYVDKNGATVQGVNQNFTNIARVKSGPMAKSTPTVMTEDDFR